MAELQDPEPQSALHVPSDPAVPLSRRPLGFSSTEASVLLDVVRGLAAVLVMLNHWRALFFVDFPQLAAHKWLLAVPYVLGSAGHQSVVIFFVLSGYLISGSVFRMLERGQWSWRSYGLHRVVRLWIVLIPGLLLVALWDWIGLHLARVPAVLLYTGRSGNNLVADIRPAFHAGVWLANLFFLQGRRIPVFGSDSPLWSLANEFWYYVLFPLGLLALRKGTRAGWRVVYALLFAGVAAAVDLPILYLFPVWLLGTLLAVVRPPRLGAGARLAATAVYGPLIFVVAKARTPHVILLDLAFGLLTFGYLWVLLSARGPSHEELPATRWWRTLARFSYTLYVAHLPLLVLLAALVLPPVRWQPNAVHALLATGILLLVVAYSYGLAALTEFRTDRVRKRIERWLPGAG